jgi:hypothetical protein
MLGIKDVNRHPVIHTWSYKLAEAAWYDSNQGNPDLVALDLEAGRLVRPFGDAVNCELAYYLIHRPRAEGDLGIAAFKNWICTEAKADSANVG